jgi:hypothetical protein
MYQLTHHGGAWWIVSDDPPMGPYTTKAEAEDDRRGLERSARPNAVWTIDPVPGAVVSQWSDIFPPRHVVEADPNEEEREHAGRPPSPLLGRTAQTSDNPTDIHQLRRAR